MVCIHCGEKTKVTNSRSQKRLNQVWRRRECLSCKAVFTSEESAQYAAIWVVKSPSGALRPFLRDKLFLSLYRSCQHRKAALSDATALTDTVIGRLVPRTGSNGVMESQLIAQTVLVALNRFDKAASTHYQAFHKSR